MTPAEVQYWIEQAARKNKSTYNSGEYIEKKYGITSEQYDTQLAQQSGLCAICHEPPTTGKRLSVDVDTVSGKPRGLLCTRCKSGIGFFKNNPALLAAAIEYIRAFEALQQKK